MPSPIVAADAVGCYFEGWYSFYKTEFCPHHPTQAAPSMFREMLDFNGGAAVPLGVITLFKKEELIKLANGCTKA